MFFAAVAIAANFGPRPHVVAAPPGIVPAGVPILPIGEVKTGMKGYGLTIVSGEEIQKFGVEVLGVVPNSTPGRSMILVRLSGLGLEETGIIAGMSGSPIFLNDRLAGAVASGWGFTKGPIGGVTPIESMLSIDSPDPVLDPSLVPVPKAPVASDPSGSWTGLIDALRLPQEERLEALTHRLDRFWPPPQAAGPSSLAPLATGFPEASLGRYREPLSRLANFDAALPSLGSSRVPLDVSNRSVDKSKAPATSGTVPPTEPLRGGSSITALLVDGDLQLGVTGTVTDVSRDGRFVAFGHPFLGLGELDLPVAPSHIVGVLPNIYQSFKIAYPSKAVYRLTKDRDSGVAGRTDRTAPMVPVHFRFQTASGESKTLNWTLAPHPKLLPILLALSADAALTSIDPTPRERTLRFRVSFETTVGPITYEDESTGIRARDLALVTASTLAGAITENDFQEPKLSGVDLFFESSSGERRLKLIQAALGARKVAPGGTVVATVRLADRRGGESTRTIRVKVPVETPEGRAALYLSDGSSASALRLALNPVEPRTLADFRAWVSSLVPSYKLVASLVIPSRGATTGTVTLSSLPPTAAALLAGASESVDSRGEVSARLIGEEVISFDNPLSGSVRLDFEVERPRS
jgi:SpoIVB peptidase S55